MDSCDDTPKGWVAPFGHPRINACSRLPVAFRSVPRPSSPPGAKASTECPSLARDHPRTRSGDASTMHRNHPQRISDHDQSTSQDDSSAHADHSRSAHNSPPLNASNRERPDPSPSLETAGNVRSDIAMAARPETHQNLIHPDKEPTATLQPETRSGIADSIRHRSPTQNHQCRLLSLLRDTSPIILRSPATTARAVVEVIGLEPTTPCLQSRCSPS